MSHVVGVINRRAGNPGSPLKKGYAAFSGNAREYHGWYTHQLTLMFEEGLGTIMTGETTAPAAPEANTSEAQMRSYNRALSDFHQKNGKLFTRLLLATSDNAEGHASVPAQIVLAHAPIGRSSPYGDGRAAIVALDKKYLKHGESRMQVLHDERSQLMVTAKDGYMICL